MGAAPQGGSIDYGSRMRHAARLTAIYALIIPVISYQVTRWVAPMLTPAYLDVVKHFIVGFSKGAEITPPDWARNAAPVPDWIGYLVTGFVIVGIAGGLTQGTNHLMGKYLRNVLFDGTASEDLTRTMEHMFYRFDTMFTGVSRIKPYQQGKTGKIVVDISGNGVWTVIIWTVLYFVQGW